MSGTMFRSIAANTLSIFKGHFQDLRSVHTAAVFYAARKGTRAKARAKKVKVEITKVGFIPHNQRGKDKQKKVNINKHLDDSYKKKSVDDVYPMKYYQKVIYTAEDAVKCHQQTHHPTMFNAPDSLVYATIELNMSAVKKNRYMENFTKLSLLPNPFPRDEERTILAFCKGPELIKQVLEAGATLAGGSDVIKKIQEGEIKVAEYDFVIAHPNILTDLVPIRGLMKRKFPNVHSGTMDAELAALVKKFAGGIQYKATKDETQQDFGSVVVPVGRLNMEPQQVAENIKCLLIDIQSSRPKREGLFITRCLITSPPSQERLKIDPFVYVEQEMSKEVREDSDDEGEAPSIAATA